MSLAGRWRAWCVWFDATAVDGGMWRLADGRLTAGGLGRDPRDHPRSLLA